MTPPIHLSPILWRAASAAAGSVATATWREGDHVAVEGRVSAAPWQHVIAADGTMLDTTIQSPAPR